MDDCFWPVADLDGHKLIERYRCKPVHLTVVLGAQKDQIWALRKIATSVT
jgi:hypothetical protein